MSESQLKIDYGNNLLNFSDEKLIKAYKDDSEYFINSIVAYCRSIPEESLPIQKLSQVACIVKCQFKFTHGHTKVVISGVGHRGVDAAFQVTDANGKKSIFHMAWNGLSGTVNSFLAWIAQVIEAIKKAVQSFVKGFCGKKDTTNTGE